jgi:hypothetical protein
MKDERGNCLKCGYAEIVTRPGRATKEIRCPYRTRNRIKTEVSLNTRKVASVACCPVAAGVRLPSDAEVRVAVAMAENEMALKLDEIRRKLPSWSPEMNDLVITV